MITGVVLAAQVALVAFVAGRVTAALVGPDHDWFERVLVGLVVTLTEIELTLQVLGAAHLLSRGWVLVAHALVAAVVLAKVPTGGGRSFQVGGRGFGALLTALLGILVVAAAAVLGLRGGSRETDTVQYHAPNAGFWLRDHQLWRMPFALPGYFTNAYPSNVELLALWLMLPPGNDQLAYVTNVAWGALLVIAVAVLTRELGGASWRGALAGLVVVTMPLVWLTHVNSLASDVGAAGGLVAAGALALVGRRATPSTRWHILAGFSLGLSLGAKYTAFLPGLGMIVLVALVAPRGLRAPRALVVSGCAASLVALWLIRNGLATGNPLFPLDVSVGGFHLLTGGQGPYTVYESSMLQHFIHLDRNPINSWFAQGRHYLGPAAVVLLAGVVVAIVRPPRASTRRLTFAVGALAVLSAIAYLATPYTGGGDAGVVFLIGSQIRYALPSVALAGALAAAVLPRAVFAVGAMTAITYDALQVGKGPGFRPDISITRPVLVATAAVAVALALLWWALTTIDRPALTELLGVRRPSLAFGPVVVVAAMTLCALVPRNSQPDIDGLLRLSASRGPVVVMSAGDVRALMGADFEVQLTKVAAGGAADEKPVSDAAGLTAAINRLKPSLVAVGPGDPSRPPDWTPPADWTRVGSVSGTDLYALPPPTTVQPSPLPPTPLPPTTVPATTVPPAPRLPVP